MRKKVRMFNRISYCRFSQDMELIGMDFPLTAINYVSGMSKPSLNPARLKY